MLAWSEGTDNGRQKTRNHGYDVIVGGELFIDYSDHPRKLVTLNSKTQINRRRTLPVLSCWWGCSPQKSLAWKTSPVSVAVALQQIKERGALPGDWSWWYPSGNRLLQQYLGFIAAGGDEWILALIAWLQNSAVKYGQRGFWYVWAESPRLSPLWLSASSSACHGLLIITVITPLPTKPSATKMLE